MKKILILPITLIILAVAMYFILEPIYTQYRLDSVHESLDLIRAEVNNLP